MMAFFEEEFWTGGGLSMALAFRADSAHIRTAPRGVALYSMRSFNRFMSEAKAIIFLLCGEQIILTFAYRFRMTFDCKT